MITGQTFNDGDLRWKNYAGETFSGCVFNGTAIGCNFARTTFAGCTFAPSFDAQRCLLVGATGLPPRFVCPEEHGEDYEPAIHPGFVRMKSGEG